MGSVRISFSMHKRLKAKLELAISWKTFSVMPDELMLKIV